MTAEAANYLEDPLYQQALEHFQRGEWKEGLSQLEELIKLYPLITELRAINTEMNLRARVDQQEVDDISFVRRQRSQQLLMRIGMFALAVVLVVWGVGTYSNWIRTQANTARAAVEQQALQLDMTVKFTNARNLLAAQRPEEAQIALDEIAAFDPNFPGLAELRVDIDNVLGVEERYQQALALLAQRDDNGALTALHAIEDSKPNYKDVRHLINQLEKEALLGDLLTEANVAFQNEEWEVAVRSYESIRAADPAFRGVEVEERLFRSLIEAGAALLVNPNGTIEEFDQANDYFRRALVLRPQDAEALAKQSEAQRQYADRQIEEYMRQAGEILGSQDGDSIEALQEAETLFAQALALRPDDESLRLRVDSSRKYLQALSEFSKSNWNFVIGNLEAVYTEDPEYAAGTARQALYESYIGRGDTNTAAGDFFSALNDYQRAAVIALDSPDSRLRLFEAQIKVAEARGLIGEYQEAVRIYRAAVDDLDIGLRAVQDAPNLSRLLVNAETLADSGNYRLAYTRYRDAFNNSSNELFNTVTYEVQEGDYLASLARRFNTTIEAIARANQIENPNKILSGQKIVIPSLNDTP